MGKFVKRSELEGADSAYKIAKLNVLEAATHVAPSKIDIGFCCKDNFGESFKETKRSVNCKCWNSGKNVSLC